MSKIDSKWSMGSGFAKVLCPTSNLMHHRVKQYMFNEMISRPTQNWSGAEWIEKYAEALKMCGTSSPDPIERATRDFYEFAIPECWIVEA